MSGFEIIRGDLAGFVETPLAIYPRRSPFVAPLNADLIEELDPLVNPLSEDGAEWICMTATRNGVPVGRISATVHSVAREFIASREGYFGFFDTIDDAGVAAELLKEAGLWLSERGCSTMVGPIGLVGSQQIGVVTEGHDRMPYMDMAWSPLWMSRLLEQCGFVRHLGMRTSEVDVGSIDIDALRLQGNDKLANHDITIEPITGDTLRAEARLIRRLGNEAFACVPYFAPVSQADSDFRLRSLKDVLDPRIAFIARIDGRPAGIVLCIPDLNPLLHDLRGKTGLLAPFIWLKHRLARPKRAVLIFYAVAPRFQGLGLNGLMLSEVARGMRRGGYKTFGITWIEDSNKPSLRQVEKLGGRPLHRLYLYRRDLERPDAQTENDVARISEIVEPKMPSIHG